MKRYRIVALTLLVMLVLASCQSGDAQETALAGDEILLYYCDSADSGLISTIYAVEAKDEETGIAEVFDLMQNGLYTDGHAAIPGGLALDHVAWQENCVVLYLTGEYPEMGTVQEILCRSALVRTLVQFDSVEGVSLYVDDLPLTDEKGEEIGILKESSFLTDISAAPTGSETVELTLYFADADGTGLVTETVPAVHSADTSLEALVIESLIAGPQEEGHLAVLPGDLGLISVQVRDAICYVNLDQAFLGLPVRGELAVYALVDSLTELDEVRQVQLMVSGSSDVTLEDSLSLISPFSRDLSLVGA